MGLVDRRPVVCRNLAMGFWVPLQYIKMYAEYAAPMMTMLKGNREETKKGSKKALVWNEESDRAFEGMKQALLSAVGLHLVDPDRGFVLRPTPRQEAPPPGTLMPPPQRAKPARKSARCAVGDGSQRRHPPASTAQTVVGPGSPPRGRAVGGGRAPDPGRPTLRQEVPPPGTLMPPPQHARARAVGLVTGPHARTPPHPQPVGSGPRQPAQRAGSREWESARPPTPHTQAGGAPPGHPHAAPTARKASPQECALWSW